jgi:hypothetical protein
MTAKSKSGHDWVTWNGRVYYPRVSPCKQDDTSSVFEKLKSGVTIGRKVRIGEDNLRNFSYIYPRLYQVGEISQKRLRDWMAKNQDTIQGWELGDFLKAKPDDILENTEPRVPSCPPGAIIKWEMGRKGVQKPLADDTANGPEIPSLTTQMLKRRFITTILSPAESRYLRRALKQYRLRKTRSTAKADTNGLSG